MPGAWKAPPTLTAADRALIAGLRDDLAERRRRGEPFPDAWEAATAVFPRGGWAGGWTAVLEETRHAWERAYERVPPGRDERALTALAGP